MMTMGPAIAGADSPGESEIPSGSTVMEMPAVVPPPGAEGKPAEKKPDPKKNSSSGAAQNAAQAILEKDAPGEAASNKMPLAA